MKAKVASDSPMTDGDESRSITDGEIKKKRRPSRKKNGMNKNTNNEPQSKAENTTTTHETTSMKRHSSAKWKKSGSIGKSPKRTAPLSPSSPPTSPNSVTPVPPAAALSKVFSKISTSRAKRHQSMKNRKRDYRNKQKKKSQNDSQKTPEKKIRGYTLQSTKTYDDSGLETRSELTVVGSDTFDGIEVTMRRNGMELMHVLGTNMDDKEAGCKNDQISLVDGAIMDHTTDVYYAEMSTRYHPICDFKSRHRIPTSTNKVSTTTFKDQVFLLENYRVVDEETIVEEELVNMWSEMKAIERESRKLQLESGELDRHSQQLLSNKCAIASCCKDWDINPYLDGTMSKSAKYEGSYEIERDQRRYLQQRRGAFLHAGFKDRSVMPRMFATKCGGNPKSYEPHECLQDSITDTFGVTVFSSGATAVRHIAITCGDEGTSFFISKDDGRSHCEDYLPNRLKERLKEEYIPKKGQAYSGSIRYLSCGPNQSYYAELVSGQVFWGIGKHDEEFQSVVDALDVHRIAFGSFDLDASWIIISKDGKLAWRNLPCTLHNLLEERSSDQAAPCEVSLGYEGSYFIRFLDGEIAYFLPSFLDDVASKILDQGADITNIIMNPDAGDAFVIRHTELRR